MLCIINGRQISSATKLQTALRCVLFYEASQNDRALLEANYEYVFRRKRPQCGCTALTRYLPNVGPAVRKTCRERGRTLNVLAGRDVATTKGDSRRQGDQNHIC